MLVQILQNTPKWVYVLFVALLWLGVSQMRTRVVPFKRIALQATGLSMFSLYSTLATFSNSALALLAWLAAAGLLLALTATRPVPQGTRYDSWRERFTMPGSALPLALIMGLFFIKFGAGIALALQPALRQDVGFALAFAAVYGAFSGVFAGRAIRLWLWAMRQDAAPAPSAAPAHS